MAQLNILANKYGFDIDDARLTIGMAPTSSRSRSVVSQTCTAPSTAWGFFTGATPNATPATPRTPKKVAPKAAPKAASKDAAPKAAKRGPTGYNLYMAEARPRIVAELQARLKSGEKMPQGAVMSEVGKRWKSLPDASRALWNARAAM